MKEQELLTTIHLMERLKDATRHCYTSGGRHESVAEHSWRMTLMAYFVSDMFPQADMNKVIRMCLIHDIGECFTGDIPTFLKTEQDEKKEENLLFDLIKTLQPPFCDEMHLLYEEMKARETLEAKIYKAMDSLEAVIQHNESDIQTWAENEYDLNMTYAYDKVAFSEYLTSFRDLVKEETIHKIEEAQERK